MSHAPSPISPKPGPGGPRRLPAIAAVGQFVLTAAVIGGVATFSYLAGFQSSEKVATPAAPASAAAAANIDASAVYKATPELIAKGKAALETSSRVSSERMSRARGPISASTAYAEVTSTTWAERPSGMAPWIQARSWVPKPVPVTR